MHHRALRFSVVLSIVSVVTVTALGALAFPSFAFAQPRGNVQGNGIHGVRIEVHGTLGYYQALGAGMRVDIPLLPDGFTDKLDDEFALSVGGDFTALRWRDRAYDGARPGYGRGWGQWYGDWSIWTVATANWNLYLGDKISVFPELGFTVSIHDCWDRNGRDDVCVTAAPVGGVGFRYHFAPPRVAFVARVNWPVGLQVGLTF
ncbi:MAG: hypothetical protein R3B40_25480 [Polyangiales bacterium]|nr:hypothetical protein [Myxococcales bacterium]MCB9656921.1 hypothetical protein [Sandaracinaceae bacterium]